MPLSAMRQLTVSVAFSCCITSRDCNTSSQFHLRRRSSRLATTVGSGGVSDILCMAKNLARLQHSVRYGFEETRHFGHYDKQDQKQRASFDACAEPCFQRRWSAASTTHAAPFSSRVREISGKIKTPQECAHSWRDINLRQNIAIYQWPQTSIKLPSYHSPSPTGQCKLYCA
jgi:predicted acyl esterase